ncbi:hypothetical protein GCM10027578_26870 [Spirosoma luteolum]
MKHILITIGALVLSSLQVTAQVVNQGTFYISSGTPVATNEAFTNAGVLTNRGTLVLRSDLTNSAQFDASQGEGIVAGSTLQTISSVNPLSFQKLTVQNTTSGESIRLNSSVEVTGQLAFTTGVIKTTAANPLLLGESAQVTGAGNGAHVVGYVSKTGNTAFVFPLGNGSVYRPAYIAPQGLPTMTLTAAYIESAPATSNRSACLQALSDKEYWTINGSGSAQVGLPYQNVATSSDITGNLPGLRVARLGTVWEAMTCIDNGGITQGFVLSQGIQPQLGQFTLAKQGLSTQILTQPVSASTVCLGGSATVSVVATGENLSYQWQKDGQPLAGRQSATLPLSLIGQADAGTYTVEVTGTYGTVTSTGFILTVSQPVASLISSGPITCSSTSTTLTATGGDSYSLSDGQTSMSGRFIVRATGIYSVTATTPQGCTAVAQTGVNAYVQTPSVSLSNNGPLSCARPTVTLTADSYVPNCAAISYSYSGPGLVNPAASYGTADVTLAGVYSVTLTDAYGCTATAQTTVAANQSAPAAQLVSDGLLSCAKPSVLLTASGGSSYQFSAGATQLNGGNTASVSIAGIYSVTVTTVDGCTATAQTTVTENTVLPTVSLANDGPLTCAKTTVTLTAAGAGSYRFSEGAAQLGTSNQASVSTQGVYSVTVTAPNGCSATAQTLVELNATLAAPTLTASALGTENTPISVTASGCSGTITWTATGGTGTADGALYTVTQPGNYGLTATCTVGSCTSPAAPALTLQIRPGGFAIRSVDLVRCQLIDAGRGQYEISLTPQYSGLSGSPVSFGVTNELATTTAPGPYTLRLYADNATIALVASQREDQATYRFNWLAACTSSEPAPNRPPLAQAIPDQVLIVGQQYGLELTSYFTDPDGQPLTFSSTSLPAGLQLSGSRITGSPIQPGSTTVQVTALDPGGLPVVGSVRLRVDPAPVTPTPGVFAIAGVTGVRCETLSAGERQLSFSPVYAGLTGEPLRFGVTNELAATSAPGPYSLRLYTDNPLITLTATQGSSTVTYRYDWLASCPTGSTTPPAANRPPVVGTGLGHQTAQAGQGYTLFIPAGAFTDPDNDPLGLSVSGLPAGLTFSAAQPAITGTPAQAGSWVVQVTATDPGNLSTSFSFVLTVQSATPPTPTPGVFAIAGVTGVRCETLSAGERQLSFSPVYTGLTGEPLRFGVTNELAATTAPGPYSLRLYTDNPLITLTATQGSSTVTYRYDWLAACGTTPNGRQAVAEAARGLSVIVLGNPVVGESVDVVIRGVGGQAVTLSLFDLAGNRLHQQSIAQAAADERVVIPFSARQAITILKVSTATHQQTVKLIRP